MFHHIYADNWESALTADLSDTGANIYLPTSDIALLPAIEDDSEFSIPLVLGDGQGTTELVECYTKTATYLTVSRDVLSLGYKPAWPTGSKIYARPFAHMWRWVQNGVFESYNWGTIGATRNIPLKDPRRRFNIVTLGQNSAITFSTGSVATPVMERVLKGTVLIKQDGTGGWTVTFPASVIWEGGSMPTLDTTADTYTLIEFTEISPDVWIGDVRVTGAS